MGEGDKFAIKLTERLQRTFYLLRQNLKGQQLEPEYGHSWFFQTGYEGHLEVLHILLRVFIRQEVFDVEQTMLKQYADANPQNALFQFAYHFVTDGDLGSVSDLMTTQYFPEDRQPSSKDRCSFYLWERDFLKDGTTSKDWLPCPEENKVFSGIDFIFLFELLAFSGDR